MACRHTHLFSSLVGTSFPGDLSPKHALCEGTCTTSSLRECALSTAIDLYKLAQALLLFVFTFLLSDSVVGAVEERQMFCVKTLQFCLINILQHLW